jgi:hypothetical protein
MPRKEIPIALRAKTATWSADDKAKIAAAGSPHDQNMERKRLLHNRAAKNKGHHIIEPVNEDKRWACLQCGVAVKYHLFSYFCGRPCRKSKISG